jgi:hypothetical protein
MHAFTGKTYVAASETLTEELSAPSEVCSEVVNSQKLEVAEPVAQTVVPDPESASASIDVTVEKKVTSEVTETVTVKGMSLKIACLRHLEITDGIQVMSDLTAWI